MINKDNYHIGEKVCLVDYRKSSNHRFLSVKKGAIGELLESDPLGNPRIEWRITNDVGTLVVTRYTYYPPEVEYLEERNKRILHEALDELEKKFENG